MTCSVRLRSLDGLRGLAAVAVVLWHAYLLVRSTKGETTQDGLPLWTLGWWLTATPLRLLIAGPEAVLVFFVLSGLVVSLPALSSDFRWQSYYVRRALRLYLPVFASIAMAILLILLVPRHGSQPGTWLADTNAASVTATQALREALLLLRAPTINNPLWSLSWEAVFSLLLPVYVFIARRARRGWPFWLLCALVLSTLGIHFLNYLPVFLIGAIAAARLEALRYLAGHIEKGQHSTVTWLAILALAALSLIGRHILRGMPGIPAVIVEAAAPLQIIGAALLVFVALGSGEFARLLETPPIQWLGRISFSLYLVHVPILVTVYYLFRAAPALTECAAVLLSLVAAAAFQRAVEGPSRRLSVLAGRAVASLPPP